MLSRTIARVAATWLSSGWLVGLTFWVFGRNSNKETEVSQGYFARIIATGDKGAVRDYFLNEPVDDIRYVALYMAERQSPAEQMQQDKALNKLISGKEFAAILRRRPELKPFALSLIVQEMAKKMAPVNGRKKM